MSETKPYHRREGEPNIWYDRFHKFMLLGPGRSLARVYRDVINAERAAAGRSLLPSSASCPHIWRQRARQFDWLERAEAYDQEQRRLSREKVERTIRMARDLAAEALQVEKDVMRGELKDPDGALTEGQNCTQRRLAAESILDRAGVVHVDSDDDDDERRIIGIRIIDPWSEEGQEHAEQVQREAEEGYWKTANRADHSLAGALEPLS